MDFEQILTDTSEGIFTITLNRPDRLNAWTAQMGLELRQAFDQADADDDVRAIIVTGAGRGFCAGADLGSGGDTFQFDTPLVAGEFATITDFAAGVDTVALASAAFTQAGAVGPLAAGAFFIGAAAHDASDRIIYNSGSGALLYDPDGTGAQAATQFATVSQGLALTAGDFKII